MIVVLKINSVYCMYVPNIIKIGQNNVETMVTTYKMLETTVKWKRHIFGPHVDAILKTCTQTAVQLVKTIKMLSTRASPKNLQQYPRCYLFRMDWNDVWAGRVALKHLLFHSRCHNTSLSQFLSGLVVIFSYSVHTQLFLWLVGNIASKKISCQWNIKSMINSRWLHV